MSDYAVGTNDGSVANRYAWHHAHIVAQPDIVANDHRPFTVERTLGERQAHVLKSALPMTVVGYEYIGAREQVVANSDAVDGCDMGVVADGAAVTNGNSWREAQAVVRVPCRQLHA